MDSGTANNPISVPKAARACGVSPQTLKRLIRVHNIPISRPRCHPRVRLSDVEKVVRGEAPKAAPRLPREAEALPEAARMVRRELKEQMENEGMQV